MISEIDVHKLEMESHIKWHWREEENKEWNWIHLFTDKYIHLPKEPGKSVINNP